MQQTLRRCLAAAFLVAAIPVAAAAQGATLTGRVSSAAGQPLPGASVFIEGLSLGTTTSSDGRYAFTVPAARATGQTVSLTARLLGYSARTERVVLAPGTTTRDFVLPVNALRLNEVVITGAGTATTREKLGNVINTVDSSLIRRANAPNNIVQALAGTAPNVEVRTQSGEPGAGSSIRIRGYTTISGTSQPLFVVDGTPIDNSTSVTTTSTAGTVVTNRASDLNPNDVESVEILKGSAAAAIYGARAANGVVLITTKSGRAGQTRYSLRSDITTDRVAKYYPLQTKFGQGDNGVAPTCAAAGCRLTGNSYGPVITGAIFDHSREILQTGHLYDNNLSMSGGNDRTTFYLSGENMTQKGIIVGSNNSYMRSSVRLKASHLLTSTLRLGGNAYYVDTRGNYVQKGSNTSGLLLGALRTPADFNNAIYLDPQLGLHRSYRYPRPTATSQTASRGYDNPFFIAYSDGNRSELGRFIGNANVEWTPLSWLTVKENFGADSYGDYRLESLPQTSSSNPVGQVTRNDQLYLQLDNNLIATATRDISPNVRAGLTLGQNLNSRRSRFTTVFGNQLIASTAPFAIQNTVSYTPAESRYTAHVEAYFAQTDIELYDQVYLTLGVRNDGYSTFGASNRRATFPKASVAWNVTNTLGNRDQTGLLSYLKLRAAYGQTGNEPGVYSDATGFSVGQSAFGSGYGDILNVAQGGQAGLITASTQGAGSSLRPERTKETEVGADFAFLNQRLELGATYYDKRSTDVILSLPTSVDATGFYSRITNGAQINNKGVELSLNAHPYMSTGLTWDVGVNWARNDNFVADLLGAEFVSRSAGSFSGAYGSVTKGARVGVLRGQDFAICGRGLVIGGVNIDQACGPGSAGALYIAANGLPVVDPTDRVIADPNPRWIGSLNSAVRVGKNLRFSGLLDVRKGGDVWNGTKGALYNFGTHIDTEIRGSSVAYGTDYFTKVYPRVAGPGAGKAFVVGQSWWQGQGGGFGSVARQFIEDGSYVKLRELSVAYTLENNQFVSRMGLSNIDLRLAGRNLRTWSDYSGLDPEANLGGSAVLVQGIDYFNLGNTRSIVLSVGLNR